MLEGATASDPVCLRSWTLTWKVGKLRLGKMGWPTQGQLASHGA